MMTSAKTPVSQFTNAVDFFFGHNPANPYWALVALAMRKEGHLEIVENFSDDNGLLLDEGTPFLRGESDPDAHVICYPKDKARINEILGVFRKYELHDNEGSIFSRNQWERSILLSFASDLIKLDEDWLQKNYDKCFAVLVRRAFAKSRFEDFSQPVNLTRLVGHIANTIAPNAKVVYDPFSGMSSIAFHIPNNATYIGEEINPLVAAIANLRLYVKGINGEVYTTDAINDHDYKADLIVSTPPFGIRIRPCDVKFPLERVVTTEGLILRKSLNLTIPAIVVTSRGINFQHDSALQLRKDLIESENLDMIINLPEKIFDTTKIGTSIYVLNPNHDHKGFVRFIDGTKSFSELFRTRVLETDSIIATLENGGDKNKLVSYDDIKLHEYNLSPELYFSEDINVPEGMKLMKISELGELSNHRIEDVPAFGKLLNFGSLNNPNPIKIFKTNELEDTELPNRPLNLVHSGLLFFGGRGNLGICVLTEGDPIFTHTDSINFIPDDDVVLPQYLLLQFEKDYVQDQLAGVYVGRMPVDVFQNIRVLIPSLEDQREAIDEYQEKLISELGLEVSNLKTEKYEEMERNLHLRRHTLGNLLNVLMPSADILRDFIAGQESVFSKDTVISRRTGLTLETLVQRIHGSLSRVESLVDKLTDSESFGIPEELNLQEFISDFVDRYPQVGFRIIPIESEVKYESADGGQRMAPIVSFSKDDLNTVFDNIVTNAKKYGFVDSEKLDNIVGISFSLDIAHTEPYVLIQIMNNGAPLASNLNPDKIFSWGVGLGTGLGGWHIKRLVEHFGGTVNVCQYNAEESDYTLGYEISLPLITREL